MAGESLREYDADLCDYVLAQLRPHLRSLPDRPAAVPKLRYREWDRLDLPTWLGRRVAALPVSLADRVWAGVRGEADRVPLSDAELVALAWAVENPPMRLDAACVWEPDLALHRRAVECVPELIAVLTKQTAEDWAEESAGFAARLCREGLSLADGVATVHEWLWRVRRLLRVMGATHLLPPPAGTFFTPTRPGSTARAAKRPRPPAAERPTQGCETARSTPDRAETAVCGWRDAMAVTGLKKTKLYELFHRGVLKGYRDGAMIRFYRAGLAAFMRDRENVPAPPPRAARLAAKVRPPTPGVRFKFL